MTKTLFLSAIFLALPALLPPAVSAQQTLAQQETVPFVCAAPAGHVRQFSVRTAAGPVDFGTMPATSRRSPEGRAVQGQILRLRPRPGDAKLQGAAVGPLVLGGLAGRHTGPELPE
jgi:hypothetical protein